MDYAAQCQGRDQGTIDRFEFRRVSVPDGQGERILFLDISSSRWSILTVLAISAGMGLLCWLGTLLLVVLLSHRALLPWPGQWKNSASLSPMPAMKLNPLGHYPSQHGCDGASSGAVQVEPKYPGTNASLDRIDGKPIDVGSDG